MLDDLLQFVPPHCQKPYLLLLEHVSVCARNVAIIGDSCGVVGHILKRRKGTVVTGVVQKRAILPVVEAMLDHVLSDPEDLPGHFEAFDAILLCNLERDPHQAEQWLKALLPRVHASTPVYALYGNPAPSADIGQTGVEELERDLKEILGAADFHPYTEWTVHENLKAGTGVAGKLMMAIAPAYNPVLHARALRETGEMAAAFHVLDRIPAPYLRNPDSRQTVFLEMLSVLADWIDRNDRNDISHLLSSARALFDAIDAEAPGLVEAYQTMARCWQYADNPAMARRLLRSVQHATPAAGVEAQLRQLPEAPAHKGTPVDVPLWDRARRPRVLFLIHPRPHYGLDALFDGLCACLGDENVVEFPWKPTLHGGETAEQADYPCRFRRNGTPKSSADLAGELNAGAFDYILYGDIEGDIPGEEAGALIGARGSRPVYLVDAVDQMSNFRQPVSRRLGLADFDGYFKREMLCSIDYGPRAYPLPFSYAEPDANPAPPAVRGNDFFWAGHRHFGQRRLFLDAIEARYGWDLNQTFRQKEYRQRLLDSRIGFNCFGMGFDTVRYWEVPAHGCMLLSDRLPIRVPFDFQNGDHAVFFDDLPDLLQKIDYYLAHPNEAAAIAAAGRAHYRAHHTNRARAAQLLAWIGGLENSRE